MKLNQYSILVTWGGGGGGGGGEGRCYTGGMSEGEAAAR